MKNNRILVYALIISFVVHSALIFLLFHPEKREKKARKYTRPILVEPYQFMKNLEKFKAPRPKYASIVPHSAKRNTRLNAPPSYRSASASSFTPPAPFKRTHAFRNNNIVNSFNYKRVMSNSHVFSTTTRSVQKPTPRLSNIFPMGGAFLNSAPNPGTGGIKNPSEGIKTATVNLNTTTIKYASYLLHVKNKIENVWEYPTSARKRGLSGILVIEFTINQDGSIYRVSVLKSSGHKVLDKAAVQAIYDGSRYNPFPDYWTIKRLNIIGTFIYRLYNFYVY